MKLIPALALFLASYFPLSLILLIQDIQASSWQAGLCDLSEISSCGLPNLDNPARALLPVIVTGASLFLFFLVLQRLKPHSSLQVTDSKAIPNDLINYVFPYVVAFMGLDLGSTGSVLGFAVFLGLMFIITYRSGQILMNPLLLVAGWQLYEVNADIGKHRRTLKALSKHTVRSGDELNSCLVQGIYVLHRGDSNSNG